ncbi:hypothetical protein QQA43_30715 (plasmid) [Mycolicibacterium vanbaalenii]|uniref:hypothetical protein n=1 Tax=Mycolicibacterium vanbaalenii TaxID=110539 RepID=UPI001F425608|nr:hypothetical protein [Mycolicibacterium vanbaalenii]WND60200.1 hypothetical protein QQA43_30715 [Mycolicibacterium vanbaalenii]
MDGQGVLTSDSTLRFREREEVEPGLVVHGHETSIVAVLRVQLAASDNEFKKLRSTVAQQDRQSSSSTDNSSTVPDVDRFAATAKLTHRVDGGAFMPVAVPMRV